MTSSKKSVYLYGHTECVNASGHCWRGGKEEGFCVGEEKTYLSIEMYIFHTLT